MKKKKLPYRKITCIFENTTKHARQICYFAKCKPQLHISFIWGWIDSGTCDACGQMSPASFLSLSLFISLPCIACAASMLDQMDNQMLHMSHAMYTTHMIPFSSHDGGKNWSCERRWLSQMEFRLVKTSANSKTEAGSQPKSVAGYIPSITQFQNNEQLDNSDQKWDRNTITPSLVPLPL